MAKYSVKVKKLVYKQIKKIPPKDSKKILDKINQLSFNPRPADCKKLLGQEKYRIRCGDYRILYEIEDDLLVVYIVKIGHRRDVYLREDSEDYGACVSNTTT